MSLTETEKNPLIPLDEEESTRPLLKRNNETHKWERVGFETPPQKWRLDSDKTRYVILLTTLAVITGLTFAIIALAGGFNQTEDGDDEDLDSLIPTCGGRSRHISRQMSRHTSRHMSQCTQWSLLLHYCELDKQVSLLQDIHNTSYRQPAHSCLNYCVTSSVTTSNTTHTLTTALLHTN
jgi:hypothetical protein